MGLIDSAGCQCIWDGIDTGPSQWIDRYSSKWSMEHPVPHQLSQCALRAIPSGQHNLIFSFCFGFLHKCEGSNLLQFDRVLLVTVWNFDLVVVKRPLTDFNACSCLTVFLFFELIVSKDYFFTEIVFYPFAAICTDKIQIENVM